MSTALLFPGQGSQFVGMGRDLYEEIPAARQVFDIADELLGWPLTEYCFGRTGDVHEDLRRLTRTEICQPALYTHSAAIMAVFDVAPSLVAGHSVGEYSALHACGVLSFAEGLRLVRLRGELMASAGQDRPGGMAAVLGLDFDRIEAACQNISGNGQVVVCANYNSPDQVVISGDQAAVEQAAVALREAGARRVVLLTVSGAFHSPLMEPARARLAEALSRLSLREPRCPIFLNATGGLSADAAEIRVQVLAQLTSPVRWAQSLQAMPVGVEFFEVGPGRVLSGLARRTLGRRVRVRALGTAGQLRSVLQTAAT
ncbi:MAG: ACP S-malonyltransferase [Bacteroidota bacterium]|nr:ACP S-malonyltransferase [Bacteroidota bacterium]MDE2835083.1 ACP S-malonyltransferase [Bacteroidota bacterium]